MKILHVQETLSAYYGGPARVLPELAKAQAAAGHAVEVVTTNVALPRGTYRDAGWGSMEGARVPVLYAASEFSPIRLSFGLAAYLRRAICKFDIVHVHGLYRFPTTYAAYEARRQTVPYIIRPHGALDPYLYNKSSAGLLFVKRVYERWFDRPNLDAAGGIHYTSDEERQRASFLRLKAPSFVVPNGVNWEAYRALPSRGKLRARWGLGDAPIVLFLGRVHFKKGLDILVQAFYKLQQRRRDAHLVIAGPENDNYGEKVRGWVRDQGLGEVVHFVGPLDGDDVGQAYVDADVFALPSYTENFGMTVAEAMASGLPVVISDQVNIHGEVSRMQAGLVTRCDADDVASALEALLKDENRRRSMGDAGRSLVQERFSWPGIVAALTREYETVIERHSSSVHRSSGRSKVGASY